MSYFVQSVTMKVTHLMYNSVYNTEFEVALAVIISPSLKGLRTWVELGLDLAGVIINGSIPPPNSSPTGALCPRNLLAETLDEL